MPNKTPIGGGGLGGSRGGGGYSRGGGTPRGGSGSRKVINIKTGKPVSKTSVVARGAAQTAKTVKKNVQKSAAAKDLQKLKKNIKNSPAAKDVIKTKNAIKKVAKPVVGAGVAYKILDEIDKSEKRFQQKKKSGK